MPSIQQAFLLVQNHAKEFSNTSAQLSLSLSSKTASCDLSTSAAEANLSSQGNNSLNIKKAASQFEWKATAENGLGKLTIGDRSDSEVQRVKLSITGEYADNSWIPSSLFVVLVDADGKSHLVAAEPDWVGDAELPDPSRVWSKDPSIGQESFELLG